MKDNGDGFILKLFIAGAILWSILQVVSGQGETCDGYYESYDHATVECVPYDSE